MGELGQREGGPMEPLWHFLTPTLLATLTPASPGAPDTNGGALLGGRLSTLKPPGSKILTGAPIFPFVGALSPRGKLRPGSKRLSLIWPAC